jgi:hypothetical protein
LSKEFWPIGPSITFPPELVELCPRQGLNPLAKGSSQQQENPMPDSSNPTLCIPQKRANPTEFEFSPNNKSPMGNRHLELKISCIMSTNRYYMDNYALLQSLQLEGFVKIDQVFNFVRLSNFQGFF